MELKYKKNNPLDPIWIIEDVKSLEEQTERIFNSLVEEPEE